MAKKTEKAQIFKRDNTWWSKNWFYTILIAIAVIGGVCAFLVVPFVVPQPFSKDDSISTLRQAVLVATGGVLAILTLWENRRKNDQEHMRQVHAERRSRYATAIEQLADEKAPIRLGGVYTLVKLVDEWLADEKTLPNEEERREEGQEIINSLCAYIRSPFDLTSKSEALSENEAPESYESGIQQFAEDQARFREEKELRLTILDAIKTRLNGGTISRGDCTEKLSKGPWSDFDYNFSNAHFFYPVDFNNSYFGASSNFSGATFTGHADFSEVKFTECALFSRTTFTWGASFSGATFAQRVVFFNTEFAKHADPFEYADFSGAKFAEEANFSEATFDQLADFSEAKFAERASFFLAIFACGSAFSNTEFAKHADFSGARFAEYAGFSEATFSQGVAFSSAEFKGTDLRMYANFSSAKFTGDAEFSRVRFAQIANFSKAKFTEDADFHGNANFSEATFIQCADFSEAEFTEYAHFSGTAFTGSANFSKVIFSQGAAFSGAKFTQSASFFSTIFKNKPIFIDDLLWGKTCKARFSHKADPEDYNFEVSHNSPYKIEPEEQKHNGIKFIVPKGTELFDPDDPSS